MGVYSIFFFMKKGVYSIFFSNKIVETEVKIDNFAQNLVTNWHFWSESLGKNWISWDIGGPFYMLTYTWGLSCMSPKKGGLSYIFRPKKKGSFRLSLPAYLFYGSAPTGFDQPRTVTIFCNWGKLWMSRLITRVLLICGPEVPLLIDRDVRSAL